MKICLCLRGIHYSNDAYITDYRKSLENYRNYIIKPLEDQGHEVDILFFTYTSEVSDSLRQDYGSRPNSVFFPASERFNGTNWKRQLLFHRCIVHSIKVNEQQKGSLYDLIINTRFDLFFSTKITEMTYDTSKFNCAFKHTSGNCDDNLWIFPRTLLDTFSFAVNTLDQRNQITHEINKYIEMQYMYGPMEYLYWTFLRKN